MFQGAAAEDGDPVVGKKPEAAFRCLPEQQVGRFEERGSSSLINCGPFRFRPFQESAGAQGAVQQRAQTN